MPTRTASCGRGDVGGDGRPRRSGSGRTSPGRLESARPSADAVRDQQTASARRCARRRPDSVAAVDRDGKSVARPSDDDLARPSVDLDLVLHLSAALRRAPGAFQPRSTRSPAGASRAEAAAAPTATAPPEAPRPSPRSPRRRAPARRTAGRCARFSTSSRYVVWNRPSRNSGCSNSQMKNGSVVLMPADEVLAERAPHARDGARTILGPRDELRDHRVVEDRHVEAGRGAAVVADAGPGRRAQLQDPARRRQEVVVRILGVDPALDRVAVRRSAAGRDRGRDARRARCGSASAPDRGRSPSR